MQMLFKYSLCSLATHLVAGDAGVWLLAGPHDEGGGHIDHLGRQDLCSSEAGLRGPGAAQPDG